VITNITPRESMALREQFEGSGLGAVEGPAVMDAAATDGAARPSPYDVEAICRVAAQCDSAIRAIERLAAILEGSGRRLPPIGTHGEIERIQVAIDQARAVCRSNCTNVPLIVRGHLSEVEA